MTPVFFDPALPDSQFCYENPPGLWRIVFPHWLLALIMAISPAAWILRVRRQCRLIRSGHCQKCGYDLRASTERCPECGTLIESKTNVDDSGTFPESQAGP
jgi:hypothetical protein